MTQIKGIYAAGMSILNNNLSLNIDKTILHAEKLIEKGCHGVPIILGEETAKKMDEEFVVIELDTIAVKGKTEPVKIYTSLGTHKKLTHIMNYDMAQKQHDKFLGWYRNKNWILARKWIDDLRNEFNGLLVGYYEMMEKRIESLEQENLPEDWDGVYRATSK